MSPTRKPKPPDKGAPPEHKPSRKVALEEVMRSLQDLVSNELAIEPAKPPAALQTFTAKPEETVQAQNLPATPSGVAETAAGPGSGTLNHLPPQQSISTSPGDVDELPDLGAVPLITPSEPPPTPDSKVPPGGIQQELPYLEAAPPAASASPPAPVSEISDAEVAFFPAEAPSIDAAKTTPVGDTHTPAATAGEIHWDDFPVLDEVVEQTEEFDTDEGGHRTDSGSSIAATNTLAPAANLPPADGARRLAIQVAARLNVELRKSGQEGLSSDIITRLARLLQEALAKSAPNMENTPSDKH